MHAHFLTISILCGLSLMVAGCTSYYRVTDPVSGRSYYTTKISEAGSTGAVKIKDVKSGGTVTLQSSEVHEISQEEFQAGIADRGKTLK